MTKNSSVRSRLLEAQSPLPRAFAAGGGKVDDSEADQRALEAARAEGRNQARDQARAELDAELKEVRRALAEGLRGIAEAHDQIVEQCRDALVELALAAASCMLRERIEENDPIAVRALEQGLAMLPSAPHVRARVHPEDRAALETAIAEQSATVELVEDGSIARGGCIIETESGMVDASVGTAEAETRNVATESSRR